MCVNSFKLISRASQCRGRLFLLILQHIWSYSLSLLLYWRLLLQELRSKYGQKKEVSFPVLVPVKALFWTRTMKAAAIAENCLRNKIAAPTRSTINPLSSTLIWRMSNLLLKRRKKKIKKHSMSCSITIGDTCIIFNWKKPEIRIWPKKFRS